MSVENAIKELVESSRLSISVEGELCKPSQYLERYSPTRLVHENELPPVAENIS